MKKLCLGSQSGTIPLPVKSRQVAIPQFGHRFTHVEHLDSSLKKRVDSSSLLLSPLSSLLLSSLLFAFHLAMQPVAVVRTATVKKVRRVGFSITPCSDVCARNVAGVDMVDEPGAHHQLHACPLPLALLAAPRPWHHPPAHALLPRLGCAPALAEPVVDGGATLRA
eukprot:751711-Hanusia_phi.AAC.6